MIVLHTVEEAANWFSINPIGSVECRNGDRVKTCWTRAEAEEFYGGKPGKLSEVDQLGSCCGTCMYWQHTSRNTPASQTVRAECRRFPPVQVSGEIPSWPRTLGKDWCGEYSYCVYSIYAVQEWKP